MLQRRTDENGLQKEKETGVGNCGGGEERIKKPEKLLFLPFYFTCFALGSSVFPCKDIETKSEGKRRGNSSFARFEKVTTKKILSKAGKSYQ